MNAKKLLKKKRQELRKQRRSEALFNEVDKKGIVQFNRELNKKQDVNGFFERASND